MAAPRMSATFILATLWLASAAPSSFLASNASDEEMGQLISFLDELKESLGLQHQQASESRLKSLVEALNGSFTSLPKNSRGALSASAARYAIHRYFTQHHGWQVKGLAPAGASWQPSTPALGLGHRVPVHIRDLFEERVASGGLDLHEVAVIVAAIEKLVHAEALGQVRASFRALVGNATGFITPEVSTEVVSTYLAAFILGFNVSELSSEEISTMRTYVVSDFPYWNATARLLHDIQGEVANGSSALAFSHVTKIADLITERIGLHIDSGDCHDIASRLLKYEDGSHTGRVRLRDFYSSNILDGNWQFREKVEYLRLMGVLDESDPVEPRVIIPNYLYSHANCLNVSRFYNLCCLNKCDTLMTHLEDKIQAPQATAEEILRILSEMPSWSTTASRTLPGVVKRKLQEVADHHHGWIPLHGRLFAQWMHFAYPRACPYPHVSGTSTLLTESEWQIRTGTDGYVSDGELQEYVDSLPTVAKPLNLEWGLCSGMWTYDEELVDALNWSPAIGSGLRTTHVYLRRFMLVMLLVSFGMTLKTHAWQGALSLRVGRLKTMAAATMWDRRTSSQHTAPVFV